MDKLISMTDFVSENLKTGCVVTQIQLLHRYKDFLKQPLTLEMFIVLDENNNPMKKMDWLDSKSGVDHDNHNLLLTHFEKQLLFDGWKLSDAFYDEDENPNYRIVSDGFYLLFNDKNISNTYPLGINFYETIEDLIPHELKLTETAKKQIGL